MSKRTGLIEKYAADLKDKCGVTADMELLEKVTIGCGPSIYNKDSSVVSGSSKEELQTVKNNFLIKKLGLKDDKTLEEGLSKVMEQYGHSNKNKHRAVVYYLLTKQFKKEHIYNKK